MTLTQRPSIRIDPTIEIGLPGEAGELPRLSAHSRVGRPGTSITVNGKSVAGASARPFAAVRREWSNGDRIEVDFDMPTRLEAVDPQHPDLLAPVHGPLALFALVPLPARITESDLLAAAKTSATSHTWRAETSTGPLVLKPFTAIDEEQYRLYHAVGS